MTRGGGWRLLRRHCRLRVRSTVALLAWSAAESVPALLSGVLVAAALDRGFLRGDVLVGMKWLGLLAAVHAVGVLAGRRVFPLLSDLVEPMRDALVRTTATAALGRATFAADAVDTADVTRLTEQTESVRQLVSALLRTARQIVMGLVGAVVGVTLLAASLVPFVAVPVAAAVILYALSLRRLAAMQRAVVLAGENVARQSGPVLRGVRDIVACGAEERAAVGVHDAIEDQRASSVAAARAGLVRTFVVLLGSQVPLLLILLAAPGLLGRGQLTVGELTGAVVYLTVHLSPALQALVQLTTSWGLQLGVVLGRLAELSQPPQPPSRAVRALSPWDRRDIEIRGLTFSYGPGAEPVLRRLDLLIPYGEHLVVVGPSGVGKSTLSTLIAGLAQPQEGEVRIGGVPVDEVDGLLPDHVGLIPQQAYVFAGTLRENLAYLHHTATDQELLDAAHELGLRPLLDRVGGLDAVVGTESVTLSVGDRQLVALARVYLSAATIVVLDEATCHLDPATEARVERAFARRVGTLVVIAHRMSSAFRADRILILDGVRAVTGTDDELRRSSSLYADLVGYWEEGTSAAPGPPTSRAA